MNNDKTKNIALLAIRLIIGGIFIMAGWMKISAMGMTIGYFAQMGIPAFLAYVVGYAEFIGGIFLVLGLWSFVTSASLTVIMLFAVYYSLPAGFQMFSFPAATLAGTLAILASGSGKYSVYKKGNNIA